MSYYQGSPHTHSTVPTFNLNPPIETANQQHGQNIHFNGQWRQENSFRYGQIPGAPLMRQAGPKESVEQAYQRNDLPALLAATLNSGEISFRTRSGNLLVHDAAQQGRIGALRVLLGRGDSPDHVDVDGRTVLMIAASRGDIESIIALAPYGPDVNQQDRRGNTALMYACQRGDLPCVRQLIAMGANKHLRNQDGTSASRLALDQGHKHIFAELAKPV